MSDRASTPHRRHNPLTGEWVLVSPQRAQRPWQGEIETPDEASLPAYDPTCYLCPGNMRAGGTRNPAYTSAFVFDNDFPALLPDSEYGAAEYTALFRAEGERGICRVVCFSPRHDLTLAQLAPAEIEAVLRTWREQTRTLFAQPAIRCVHVFENKGAMMGCSNPHPHSQIWATEHLTNEVAKELEHQHAYARMHDRSLLVDYVDEERRRGVRVVCSNEHVTALVPYWAVWPFETIVVPHRAAATLMDLDEVQTAALAEALKALTVRYDALFGCRFPYTMGIHQAPIKDAGVGAWQLHLHAYPPLLSSPTVRKFMVGFELLGMPQRDFLPEEAAARLRASKEHVR